MKNAVITAALAGSALFVAGGASAQTMPMGEELRGQTVQVQFADGTRNTVMFEEDGDAMIRAADGTMVEADWFVQGQQLCLQNAMDRECWPYRQRFTAGQPLTLTSTCDATSQWTALSTAPMAPPPVVAPPPPPPPAPAPVPQPMPTRTGERG